MGNGYYLNNFMERFKWEEKYSVGVKEIDKQHQRFFEIANDIIEIAEKKDMPLSELLFKITNLSNYAVYHLLTEESIFKRYNYPDAMEHIGAHNAYREKMKEIVSAVETNGVETKALSKEMAEFAGNWLMDHIMAMDKKYVSFMREAGIK